MRRFLLELIVSSLILFSAGAAVGPVRLQLIGSGNGNGNVGNFNGNGNLGSGNGNGNMGDFNGNRNRGNGFGNCNFGNGSGNGAPANAHGEVQPDLNALTLCLLKHHIMPPLGRGQGRLMQGVERHHNLGDGL